MSNKQAINLTSLSLIQNELMTAIDDASTHLETFISERDNLKVLEDCVGFLQQIRGSLDLIQMYGACELAGEILSTASEIDIQNPKRLDEKLAALTKGFFVLSCYFEYTQQHEVGMPVLLIPYINDIRLVNNKPTMPESYFEQGITTYRCPKSARQDSSLSNEELHSQIRRFRHMYQVGLLGFIKEMKVEQSLKLMHRAVSKVVKLSYGTESETLWWLASYSLNALISAKMLPNVARKRLLVQIDKQLRLLVKVGESAFNTPLDEYILKELAYYIAISGVEKPEFEKIKHAYGFEHIGYTETVLQKEAISLTGPSANTVQSVADVLHVELNIAKENIERTQLSECDVEKEYEDTISRIQNVKEILSVVGLTSAAEVLTKPLDSLQTAFNTKTTLEQEVGLEVADAFLYVESVLSSLEKRNFSGDKLAEMNKLTRNEMISKNHLQDAQLIVIEEAENGLSTVKNALTAFSDSNYDKSNLEGLTRGLDEVRGGMVVLSLPRAAAIVNSCSDFIEKTLIATDEAAALEHMLETFADALICLEYYLDCMKVDKNVSPDTLAVAEESLAALGYSVSE